MAHRTPFAHLLLEAASVSAGSNGKNQGWREVKSRQELGEHRVAGVGVARFCPHAPPVGCANPALNSPGLSTPSTFPAHRGDAVDPPDCLLTTANFAGNLPNGFRVPRKLNRDSVAS